MKNIPSSLVVSDLRPHCLHIYSYVWNTHWAAGADIRFPAGIRLHLQGNTFPRITKFVVCLINIQQQKAVLPTNLFNLQAKQPLLAVTVQKIWKKASACLNNDFHFLCTSKLLEMSKFKWDLNRQLYYLKVFLAIFCLPCIIFLIRVRVKGNSDKSTASWETLLKKPMILKAFFCFSHNAGSFSVFAQWSSWLT